MEALLAAALPYRKGASHDYSSTTNDRGYAGARAAPATTANPRGRRAPRQASPSVTLFDRPAHLLSRPGCRRAPRPLAGPRLHRTVPADASTRRAVIHTPAGDGPMSIVSCPAGPHDGDKSCPGARFPWVNRPPPDDIRDLVVTAM